MENLKLYWFSFAGKNGNLGICIVEAKNKELAHEKTHELKINPGGEALIVEMKGEEAMKEAKEFEKNRLYTPKEMRAKDYESINL